MTSKIDPGPARNTADLRRSRLRPAELAARFKTVRSATERLIEPLSAEDCAVQSMQDCSPAKWHLAHTSWFFETFVAEPASPSYSHFHPQFRFLFNSYYQSVGAQYPRPQRGLLTRPGLQEVLSYREHVNKQILTLLSKSEEMSANLADVIELGIQHEQQHQELLLTDIKNLFSCNPLKPTYRKIRSAPQREALPAQWHQYPEGIAWIGNRGEGFAFDNERPRHRVFLDNFEIASRLVTGRDFVAFIEENGYKRPELWLSDGWNVAQSRNWEAPLYWERRDGEWYEFTLSGLGRLNTNEPVSHVSYYEADAYARWAGARLPTETEWEWAAADLPVEGNFVESGLLHPSTAPIEPSTTPLQMFGDVWEWTASPYCAYPRYRPPIGALGEYNGKFMSNQMVLRGGSCATPLDHIRATYRNFFPPDARWQFTGIRLARDAR
jgi:ergothioneine biosynthesis protein EgtB